MYKLLIIVCMMFCCADYLYSQSYKDKTYLADLIRHNEYKSLNAESENLLFKYPNDQFILKANMLARSELGLSIKIDMNSNVYFQSLIYKYDSGLKNNRYFVDDLIAQVNYSPIEFRQFYNNRILFDSIVNLYDNKRFFKMDYLNKNTNYSLLYENYHNSFYNKSKTVLFSLFPGGGYFYNNEYSDGIVALLSILVFSSLSILSWHYGNKPVATLSGSAAGIFYFGSIIGSYNQTVNKNEIVKKRVAFELAQHFNFKKDRIDLLNEK